jgi:hypothetical protein
MWCDGVYHGHGRKLYSKGGGYEGAWVEGQRQGLGVSFYDGKFGLARWEGPFVGDKPHGQGQLYYPPDLSSAGDEHGRWEGDIAIKGPLLEFEMGMPLNESVPPPSCTCLGSSEPELAGQAVYKGVQYVPKIE